MTIVRIDHGSLRIDKHMMHETLKAYIDGRIHPLVGSRIWPRILVCGHYVRDAPNVHISRTEKDEKRFNWHRPTAMTFDDSTLEIRCFPGRDCVQHHALLIAYHLALKSINTTASVVEYIVPAPEDCMDLLLNSNLRFMGPVDIVVLGYVDQLVSSEGSTWETGTDASHQLFAWKRFRRVDGRVVAFVGSMMSLWGDIIGKTVHTMRIHSSISCVLYIGKAGSLRPQDVPNEVMATGESSRLNGNLLQWECPLHKTLSTMKIANICRGTHVTVSSPLVETEDWLYRQNTDWVDCEVGHLAEACKESRIQFGYLNLISDNVARKYPHDLATERQDVVLTARKKLLDKIRKILAIHLGIEDPFNG